MLCYRCGSHVPDSSECCGNCGQKLSGGGLRQATGSLSHKRIGRGSIAGAPYKPGDLIAGRYAVEEVVGSGPVGFVLRAHDEKTGGDVAVKVINPMLLQTSEERACFSERMSVSRKLSHANLVHIQADGEDKGWPFYVMQFVEGLTLRKIIDLRFEKRQVFNPHEVEAILAQIASALEAGQKVGPHGDLKPENVVVLPDLLKVSDHGLALAIPRMPFVQALKARNAERYLAPEYAEGAALDGRADVYALGVILGEMLSGKTPTGSISELSGKNPGIPFRVEGLYRKAMNQEPRSRFDSGRELVQELKDALRAVPAPRGAPTPARAPNLVVQPHPPLVAVGVPLAGAARDSLGALSRAPAAAPPQSREEAPECTQPMNPSEMPDQAREFAPAPGVAVLPPVSPLQRVSHPRRRWTRRTRTALAIALLAAGGLIVGSAVGYWVMRRAHGADSAGQHQARSQISEGRPRDTGSPSPIRDP